MERARRVGARVVLHKLTTPAEVASARALARTRAGQAYAHPTTVEGNEHLAVLMEEPSPDEGVQIVEL